jgi:hypothetical protein
MRRLLSLLGVGAVLSAGIGCHCVAGKCDCTGDKIITHPYSMCAEVHQLLSLSPHQGHDGHLPGGVPAGYEIAPPLAGAPAGVPVGDPAGMPAGSEKLPLPKGGM